MKHPSGNNSADQDLIRQILRGDSAAFGRWSCACRAALNDAGSAQAVDEAIQEIEAAK